MRIPPHILALPPALLLLILTAWSASAHEERIPKPAAHEKYWPEYEVLARREAPLREILATARPVGVRKMSHDEGEKFFLHYWDFDAQQVDHEPYFHAVSLQDEGVLEAMATPQLRSSQYHGEPYMDTSIFNPLLPPLRLHSNQSHPYEGNLRVFRRAALQKRAYQCPTGTNACTQINRPNICCESGATCVLVTDTGLGDVGCCPAGTVCGGQVSSCNTAQGYSNCPNNPNGGCCIPGFTCQDIGCVTSNTLTVTTTRVYTLTLVHSTETVVVTPATSTVLIATTTIVTLTPTSNNVIPAATSATTIATSSPQSVTTTIVTVYPNPSASLTCSTGYQSCPASMGGGCCPTDRACGATECPALSTAAPPVRPTSEGATVASTATMLNTITTTATTQPQQSTTGTVCPVGYYMCIARYLGGCCRVGRNCDTTSCPPGETTTVVGSAGGPVIVVTSNGGGVIVQSVSSSATGASSSTTTTSPPSTSTTTVGVATPSPTNTITTTPVATLTALGQGSCASGWYNCDVNLGGGCCPSGFGCGASCTATVQGVGTGAVAKIAPSSGGGRLRGWSGIGWGLGGLVAAVWWAFVGLLAFGEELEKEGKGRRCVLA